MIRWHLCNPMGVSERTCEAESEFWAKRRFAPIPKGWFVASEASYRMGWQRGDVPDLCSKCFLQPATDGFAKCASCRATKARQANTRNERKRSARFGKNAESSTRSASMRAFYANETPEAKAARSARLREVSRQYHARKQAKQRAREKTILRGIEHRRAKRAQLSLAL